MEGPGMVKAPINLSGLFARGARKIGAETAMAGLLLLVCMGSVAYGLTLVVRGLTVAFSVYVAASGLLVGWLLARSGLDAWRSGMLASMLGIALQVVHLGSLEGTFLALLLRANRLVLAFFQGPPGYGDFLENSRAILPGMAQLIEMLGVLLERLLGYLASLISSSPVFDPLVSLIVWGMVLWATSFLAAWGVRRAGKPLAALLPGGALLAACLSYARGEPTILLPYLGAALLLILFIEHQARRRYWEATHTDYSEELSLDIALLAVPLSAMILAAAAFSPSLSPRRISQLVQEALRQPQGQIRELGDSLGLQRAPVSQSKLESLRSTGMPRQHLIGSGPELSEQVVMEVSTLEIGGLEQDVRLSPENAARLNYWRWLVYDTFTGSGWRTGPPETLSYGAGEPAQPPGWEKGVYPPAPVPNQLLLTQEIEILDPSRGALYVSGTVVTTDAAYQIAWRPFAEATGPDIFGGSVESSHYRVRSLVLVPEESRLKTSGGSYPEELLDRYLTLPDSVPPRVHALALELTATLSTPYERARAIENYLRNIPYSLEVPIPPRDADIIDYYLFELKRGYCDYAASAMVVLARAAGIPARLVTGYAGGRYEAAQGVVVVTEADAHSWAELYFPDSGWVEFEPTGSRPGLGYNSQGGSPVQVALESPSTRPAAWPVWFLLGIFPAGVAIYMAGWQVVDRWRLGKMAPDRAVQLLYDRLYRSGAGLTPKATPAQTPSEFAHCLSSWMESVAASSHWGKWIAVLPSPVNRLTELYIRVVYSPNPPGPGEKEQAMRDWMGMRWRLWLLRNSPLPLSNRRTNAQSQRE